MKLALIGAGRWGAKYLDIAHHIPGCEIAYVRTRDYRDLLGKKDIDGIIIATPATTHFAILSQFPNTFLLVEKPLTTSLAETLLIRNQKIMVGHTFLYHTVYQDFKRRVKKETDILWTSWLFWNTSFYQSDTTILWELGPHVIATLLDLFGTTVELVRVTSSPGTLSVHLLVGTVDCYFTLCWNARRKVRRLVVTARKNPLLVFDTTKNSFPSALQNELEAFLGFIQGKPVPTGLSHAIQTARVLDRIEKKLCEHQ